MRNLNMKDKPPQTSQLAKTTWSPRSSALVVGALWTALIGLATGWHLQGKRPSTLDLVIGDETK